MTARIRTRSWGKVRRSLLFGAASWAMAGNATVLVSQAAALLILVRLGGTEMAGRYTLALAITAPIMLLCFLQLRAVQATDADRRHAFTSYLALRLVTVVGALAVVATVMLWRRDTLAVASVVFFVALMKSAEGLSDIALGAFQLRERMDRYAVSQILRSVALLLALMAGLVATGSLMLSVALAFVGWTAILALYDLPAVRSLTGGPTTIVWAHLLSVAGRAELIGLARTAAPLGIAGVMISLRNSIPVYVLEDDRGTAAVGLFSSVSYFPTVGAAFVVAIGQSVMPRLAVYYACDRRRFTQLLAVLLAASTMIGLAGVTVAIVAGGPVLRILYGSGYEANAPLLTVVMVGGAMTYLNSAAGIGITACRAFRPQAPALALALLAGGAAAWLLIPSHGALGAAWSVVVSGTVWLLANIVVLALLFARPESRIAQ